MKVLTGFLLVIIYACLLSLCLCGMLMFSGCATPEKLIQKALSKDTAAVARATRDLFPCTDILKPDTAVIFKDTTIYVDCPDTTNSYETIITDTVNRVVTKTIRVPVTVKLPGTTITKWYEDSAKLKLASLQVQGLRKDVLKLQDKNDSLAAKLKTRTKLMWLFLVIAVIMTAWSLRKLFI